MKINQILSAMVFLFVSLLLISSFGFTVEKSLGQDNNLVLINNLLAKKDPVLVEKIIMPDTKCQELKIDSKIETNSVVTFLQGNCLDSSFDNRGKIASKVGIDNYTGTQQQNIELFKALKENHICL